MQGFNPDAIAELDSQAANELAYVVCNYKEQKLRYFSQRSNSQLFSAVSISSYVHDCSC